MPFKAPNKSTDAAPPVMLGGKKSDLAYGALKRAIMLREFEPGQQIREQSVAAKFHCSQSTVREALINLSKDGLVNRTGYHGTHVTDTTLEEATALVRVRLSIERSVAAQLHARGPLELAPVNAQPWMRHMRRAIFTNAPSWTESFMPNWQSSPAWDNSHLSCNAALCIFIDLRWVASKFPDTFFRNPGLAKNTVHY